VTSGEARFRTWLGNLICPECKRERIAAEEARIATRTRARHLFHVLWTKGHDGPDYNKKEWTELSNTLSELGVRF
jgi:hypothetical protein